MKLVVLFLTLITIASCTHPYQTRAVFDINAWARTISYPLNVYSVDTSDGYILTLFRLNDENHYNNRATNRPVVLLMHGLMSSGADFVYGVEEGLFVYLFNAGFDVFIGNMRGSQYGMRHKHLRPDRDSSFWRFSFDEIATRDLPAMVDKVLEISKQQKISYVGHMEGTMVFYMMLSELPNYVNKFYSMVSLGPMAFMKNSPNKIWKKIINNHTSKEWIIKNLGQNMFNPSQELLSDFRSSCQNSDSTYKSLICNNYYFLIKGFNSTNLNTTTLNVMLKTVPFGGSVNQFLHLAQMAESGRFQTYSPAWSGRIETHEYDLSEINIPVAILYTRGDTFSEVNDIVTLINHLPHLAYHRNFEQLTNSIDLLYSENLTSSVYRAVRSFLTEPGNAYSPCTYTNNRFSRADFWKNEGLHPNTGLNMTQLVTKYDYPIETYEIQTEDSYILTTFRIPHGRNETSSKQTNRPPIMLMHGLLSSSADWVNTGPEKALGLILADAGYDVWFGNQRGNIHSRKHINLDIDKDKQRFFNFSWHEIGYYDVPATIDFILNKTQQDKLFYIGMSQGTTVFFVMASERPEYNEKIRLMAALAPVTYMGNLKSPLVRLAANNYDQIVEILNLLEIYEFLPYSPSYLEDAIKNCNGTEPVSDECTRNMFLMSGFDPDQWDPKINTVLSSNGPAGAAVGQLKHYMQLVASGRFQQYDYGPAINKEKYGSESPPNYSLPKVTAPVAVYCGQNDWLSNITDAQQMMSELPNVAINRVIAYPKFNHVDFHFAIDVVEFLYNDLLNDLKNYLLRN